jgi:hypothetical protein
MAKDGRQVVLRTLRSIARASGRVSIVIIIFPMLVDSERKLLIAHCLHFTRKDNAGSTQEVQFVLVRGDGVQGLREKLFELCHISLLRLDCFLMLDESLE